MTESRQIVCLASTMRSGSTLLKALLAEAPDISNLPEVNFQKYSRNPAAEQGILDLDPARIVLLKRPAWYTECKNYPKLPQVPQLKVIVLVRDAYNTVESCRKMTFWKFQKLASTLIDRRLAKGYWLSINRLLLNLHMNEQVDSHLIRYEDLVGNPIDETKSLFEFVGSTRVDGVDSYSAPDEFRWRWGRDDGSPNIRSLKVQPPRNKPQSNRRLADLIDNHSEIRTLRQDLGYLN